MKSMYSISMMVMAMLPASMALAQSQTSPAMQKYEQAYGLFDQRGGEFTRDASGQTVVDQAIAVLDEASAVATNDEERFDIDVLKAHAYYWKGTHQAKASADARNENPVGDSSDADERRMRFHDAGKNAADAAIALSIGDKYAEGYYYAGINLARWAEAKGVTASLGRKKELFTYMDKTLSSDRMPDAIQRTLRDGVTPGGQIDGYGPYRVLGRAYYKLPGFAGGDRAKSAQYLRAACDKNAARNYIININFLAETLNAGSKDEKVEARALLDEVLANGRDDASRRAWAESNTPDRIAETLEEFADAAKLRGEMR